MFKNDVWWLIGQERQSEATVSIFVLWLVQTLEMKLNSSMFALFPWTKSFCLLDQNILSPLCSHLWVGNLWLYTNTNKTHCREGVFSAAHLFHTLLFSKLNFLSCHFLLLFPFSHYVYLFGIVRTDNDMGLYLWLGS